MRIEFRAHRPAPLRAMAVLAGVALFGTVGFSMAGAAGPADQASTVVPLAPERILDTRTGVGQAAPGPVVAGQTIRLQVAGVGSIPADATGVVLNVTATRATAASYVTAWPAGTAQPNTSILNFSPGGDIANMITATLGADGAIDLYNSAGSVDLVADVAGYLAPETTGSGTPGPAGPQGAVGPQGPTGAKGPGAIVLTKAFLPDAAVQSLGTFGGFTASVSCTAPFGGLTITSVTPGEQMWLYGMSYNGGPMPTMERQTSPTGIFWLLGPNTVLSVDGLLSRASGEYFQVRIEITNSPAGCSVWGQFTPGNLG